MGRSSKEKRWVFMLTLYSATGGGKKLASLTTTLPGTASRVVRFQWEERTIRKDSEEGSGGNGASTVFLSLKGWKGGRSWGSRSANTSSVSPPLNSLLTADITNCLCSFPCWSRRWPQKVSCHCPPGSYYDVIGVDKWDESSALGVYSHPTQMFVFFAFVCLSFPRMAGNEI